MSIQKITTGVIEDSAITGSKISVGTPEAGDIIYHDGTEYVKLAKGTDGDVLKLENGLPAWGVGSGGGDGGGGESSGGGGSPTSNGPGDAFIISGTRGESPSIDITNYSFTTSSESVWGTCLNNGSSGRNSGCPSSSTTDGFYVTGTIQGSNFTTDIEKYSYSSEGDSTDIGNINQHKTVAGGVSSSTEGYVLGGSGFNITGHSSNGQKFAFSNGSSSTNVMSLEIPKAGMGTHQDSTHGYTFGGVAGGGNNPVVAAVSSCCRFLFANDTSREDIPSLNEASAGNQSTVGNNINAYIVSGSSQSNQGDTVFYTRIDSYALTNSSTATDHGDLNEVQSSAYGASTNTTGLVVGGSNASIQLAIKQEYSYASNTLATQLTPLTSTAGGGGHGQVPPTF